MRRSTGCWRRTPRWLAIISETFGDAGAVMPKAASTAISCAAGCFPMRRPGSGSKRSSIPASGRNVLIPWKWLLHGARNFFVADVPLFFEKGFDFGQSEVLVVASSRSTQIQRLKARGGFDDSLIESILAAQLPVQEKMSRADVVFWNEGPQAVIRSQIRRFAQAFLMTLSHDSEAHHAAPPLRWPRQPPLPSTSTNSASSPSPNSRPWPRPRPPASRAASRRAS